jgi:HAD superfamily hydrolase (TIGR01509 family)
LLSNSWGGRDYPLEQLREIFDAIVISGEVGLRKPEPEIYRYTARKLDVPAEECVFIDDFSVNVEGAEAVGMTGVLHRNPQETVARLEDLFDLDLGSPADARSTQR